MNLIEKIEKILKGEGQFSNYEMLAAFYDKGADLDVKSSYYTEFIIFVVDNTFKFGTRGDFALLFADVNDSTTKLARKRFKALRSGLVKERVVLEREKKVETILFIEGVLRDMEESNSDILFSVYGITGILFGSLEEAIEHYKDICYE